MKEHKKANNMLMPIAKIKKVTIPKTLPEDEMEDINDLNEKSGKEFSKEYIDKVVDMHEESVEMYQKASENLKDEALNSFASQMLPDMQRHLNEAKKIQKNLEERPASIK